MNGTSRRRLVSWLLIGLGITLMLLRPSVMWSEQQRLLRLQPHVITPAPVLSTLLPLGGVVLCALGWLLVGAGVWCGRGLLVAAAAYMVIGAVWMMVFNVSLGTSPTSLLHPSALLVAYPPPSWSARAVVALYRSCLLPRCGANDAKRTGPAFWSCARNSPAYREAAATDEPLYDQLAGGGARDCA